MFGTSVVLENRDRLLSMLKYKHPRGWGHFSKPDLGGEAATYHRDGNAAAGLEWFEPEVYLIFRRYPPHPPCYSWYCYK